MIDKLFHADVWHEVVGEGENWLVFLHGWGTDSSCFSNFVSIFKKSFKILLIDFPPFGKSSEPSEPWTLDTYVSVVKTIFEKENVKNPTIVAHSFGGRVAILLSSRYNNVKKLILWASAGLKSKITALVGFKKCVSKICKFLKTKSPKWVQSADYRVLSPVMKKTFSSIIERNLEDECKKISCPTLLIWGNKDDATPLEIGKKMNKLITNSGLFVIKNAGHFAFLSHSQIFANAIQSFCLGTFNK